MAWCTREDDSGVHDMVTGMIAKGPGARQRPACRARRNAELIRQLGVEAIDFVGKKRPGHRTALAKETWRMEMMTPERQLINPFFTGGEVISVSFPTDTMTFEQA